MPNLSHSSKELKNILHKRNMSSYEMGKDINESWLRCINEGLDPFNDPKQSVISSIELKEIKERNEAVRRIIIPELELLYSQIAGTNFMVAYSDEKGLVLDTIYDKSCLQTDVGKTVIPGSIWAERFVEQTDLAYLLNLKNQLSFQVKNTFLQLMKIYHALQVQL